MFIMLATVGSFGVIIAMVWLVIAAIRFLVPAWRSSAGWHAGRASIALLVAVAAFSFGSTQVYRDLGFSSWPEMIDHFRTDAGAR